MNFKELCEFVAEEVNGSPLTFPTTTLTFIDDPFQRKIIKAVKKAYMDVLLFSNHWRFLQQRGEILTTIADTNPYTLSTIESIDEGSLYLLKSGSTARQPVYMQSYDWWTTLKRAELDTASQPVFLIRDRTPDDWILWPTPDAVYTLNGDSQLKPVAFSADTDEPLWDSQYHEMLGWLVIRQMEARVVTQDEAVTVTNASAAQSEFASNWIPFMHKYLPQFRGMVASL